MLGPISLHSKLVLLVVFIISIVAFVYQIHYIGGFKFKNVPRSSISVLNRKVRIISERATYLHSMINSTSPAVAGVSSSLLGSFRSPFHKYYPVNCSAVFRGNTSEIRRIGKLFHDYENASVVPSDLEVSMIGRSEI